MVEKHGPDSGYSSVAGNGTGIERYIGTVHPSRKIWRSNSKWYPWRPKRNIVLCLYSMGFIEYYEDEETGIQHTQPAEDECVMRACRKVGVETSDYHPPSIPKHSRSYPMGRVLATSPIFHTSTGDVWTVLEGYLDVRLA